MKTAYPFAFAAWNIRPMFSTVRFSVTLAPTARQLAPSSLSTSFCGSINTTAVLLFWMSMVRLMSRSWRPPFVQKVSSARRPRACGTSGAFSGAGFQHHPETRLPAHHAVVSLTSFIQRVRLDQRLHSGERAEPQRVLRVDGRPAGPARYYLPCENHRNHAHLYRLQRHTDDHERPTTPQPADRGRHRVRVRDRRKDGSGTAQLL